MNQIVRVLVRGLLGFLLCISLSASFGQAADAIAQQAKEFRAQSLAQKKPQLDEGFKLTESGFKLLRDCAECPEMVVIPDGSFTMGSVVDEQVQAVAGGLQTTVKNRESPQHPVNITGFAAGRYAVTKAQFAAFVRAQQYQTEAERGDGCSVHNGAEWKKNRANNWRNVGFGQTDDHPVVCVSWNDAKAYAQWLSQLTGKSYRLMSEAEREYVARAGTQTAFWWGDSINPSQANYDGTGAPFNGSPKGEWRKATVAVNSYAPNPFGLYGVHGNVWEWVEDVFHDNYTDAPVDGSAWTSGGNQALRVLRGGAWYDNAADLRSAGRYGYAPVDRIVSTGFRIARTL